MQCREKKTDFLENTIALNNEQKRVKKNLSLLKKYVIIVIRK
jgi:hypothetical protein